MHHHPEVWTRELWWILGWLVAMAVLFWFAIRLPLRLRYPGLLSWLYSAGIIIAAVAVLALANSALNLHHVHFDLTREKIYTPSDKALSVVRELTRPVKLTYFYRADDERGIRAERIVTLMGHTNPLLQVVTADPDKKPELARAVGGKTYNSAVIQAEGRRLVVRSVDETEIALGIQRVLRQHVVTVCFMQGHNEFPPDNYAFHTHVEGLAGHEHDGAASAVIRASAHGIGRLRRALESVGYEIRKVTPAVDGTIPDDCRVLIAASPRTTFLPAESAMLENYLRGGGALLAMFDLGFVLEPRLAGLMAKLGLTLPQAEVIDPKSHYSANPEMVAVTGYNRHAITRTVSFTFYPGVRPIRISQPAGAIRAVPLVSSTASSYAKPVAPVAAREVQPVSGTRPAAVDSTPGSHDLAAAVEGKLPGSDSKEFRAVVIGDGDFASNSFFPFMSNNQLALSMVRWLAREDKGTAIATRVRVPPLILLTNTQTHALFVVLVILLPLSVLALGGAIWWSRR
jgi:gliding motility-associatede transport system auxiliary component